MNSSQNPNTLPKKTSRKFVTTTLLTGVLLSGILLYKHQAVYDWLRLRNYQAPPAIVAIANDDKLTASAKRVLYVNHPAIQTKSQFAGSCPSGSKETAVLGCYVPNQHGIFVLSVTDQRLAGIEQVTTAHELLHAEYDRLSPSTKRQVAGWLMDYYQHNLHDQTIVDQLNSYKKTEPNDLVNEMHSIFGTEVSGLPAPLEHYYKRYFVDRSTITSFYDAYEVAFTSRQLQIKQDDARLAGLKMQIDQNETDLKVKQAALAAQQNQLVAERNSGNASAYNAGVPQYNSAVNAYNAEVKKLHSLIAEYNQLVSERNAIALEAQQLTQDITSQVAPINKQ